MSWMESTLQSRLRRWIEEGGTEWAADLFAPALAEELSPQRGPEYLETSPVTDSEWEHAREQLTEAGFTPERMEAAAGEYDRAIERGWSLREWLSNAHERILPEEEAERATSVAEGLIEDMEEDVDLGEPPPPKTILTYRAVLDSFGGGAGLAALTEAVGDGRPTN